MADEVWRQSLRGRLNQLAKGAGIERTDPAELRDILGDELCAPWDVPGDGTVEAVREKITAGLEDLIQRFVSEDEKLTIYVSYNIPHPATASAEDWNSKKALVRRREWLEHSDRGRLLVPKRTASRTLETFLDNAASYLENGKPVPGPPEPFWQRRFAVQGAALIATLGVAVGGTALFMSDSGSNHSQNTAASNPGLTSTTSSARTIPDTGPRPASPSNSPVLVEATPLAHDGVALFYALPENLDMSPSELAAFNETSSDTDSFAAWLKQHKAVLLGNSTTRVTLIGNDKNNPVSIIDIQAVKQCHAPTEPTILAALGGSDPASILPLSIDLDKKDPYAQTPDGARYFSQKSLPLAYNEQETMAVDIHTTSECSFTLKLVIATTSGMLTQTIDDNGKPFELTSWRDPHHGYSAYQEVYMQALDDVPRVWTKEDPKTLP